MSIAIDKNENGYVASGYNLYGRFVTAELDSFATLKMVEDSLWNQKSELELEKEKLIEDNKFLVKEWACGKSDDELLARKDIFSAPEYGAQIEKGCVFLFENSLFKAKSKFKYSSELAPDLAPEKWSKIGKETEDETV